MDTENRQAPNKPTIDGAAAEIVRDARRRCGLTQQQFADALGVTWQYVSQIERSERAPSTKLMKRVAAVLSEHAIPDAIHSPAEASLVGFYRTLAPEAKQAVDTLVSGLGQQREL
ncbi:MAG: helix-turn-helix domain-containing protein [Chitinispirillales bacterium]|jgi:transcriptional regulator with XRE-family HTH domain|nr:helix-turn-helix domain-containing protein [Chitinispirillales bacterium]